MKIIKEVQLKEVWNHWNEVEGQPKENVTWRSDIRCPLPCKHEIRWYLAEVEEQDLKRIFIISSDDWRNISKTFQLSDAVDSINKGIIDEKVNDILAKKRIYQSDIGGLDRRLILVAPSIEGNFTIIEGNKRAVALLIIGKLVGNQIYLGISNEIRNYIWARHSK